jgi:hypothetical protein
VDSKVARCAARSKQASAETGHLDDMRGSACTAGSCLRIRPRHLHGDADDVAFGSHAGVVPVQYRLHQTGVHRAGDMKFLHTRCSSRT